MLLGGAGSKLRCLLCTWRDLAQVSNGFDREPNIFGTAVQPAYRCDFCSSPGEERLEVSRLNLHTAAPALQMPIFFFLGRRDHWVPPETSVAYFDALKAPSKKLVWFEKSGHEPFVDEAAKFNAAMVELVLRCE